MNFDPHQSPQRTVKSGPEVLDVYRREKIFFFFAIQAVSVFALRVFLFAGVRRTKRCEPVPCRWLDGEQRGQCYSHRSLRQDSPTRWIISGLCRYCRGVGKEWQHYTLLERDGEQLAVLEDSHICIKYRPASYY